ncbi:MAG: hypothetical protein WBC15_04515 [Mycobacterium sp.]
MPRDDGWDDDERENVLETDEAMLEVLAIHASAGDGGDDSGGDDHNAVEDHGDPQLDVIFTVTNPAGSLSAIASLGGRLQRIQVLDVSQLDEARLGEEVLELATLARDKARAAQHEVVADLMRGLGQDRAGVSALLEHSVGLPTHEAADAQVAAVFAAYNRSSD